MENHTHTGADNNSTRDSETISVERVTNESLKQSAQKLLEDYYNERDSLIGQITAFEGALDSARADLKALVKKNKFLLQTTQAYKTQEEHLFDIIKNNPGATASEIYDRSQRHEILASLDKSGISANISFLCKDDNIQNIEGRYYAKNDTHKKCKSIGATAVISLALKAGPKSKKDILLFLKNQNFTVNERSLSGLLQSLKRGKKVISNKTYKGQRNIIYTWIGD